MAQFRHGDQLAIAGVLYAEDFDLVPILAAGLIPEIMAVEPEPELLAPSFSLEELREASQQSFEEGREFERMAALTSLDTHNAACLARLVEQITDHRLSCARLIETGLDTVASTALTMIATALPSLCALHAEQELAILLRRILPPLKRLPELRVRLHPAVRPRIEREVYAILHEADTSTVWTETDALAPGDIAISWENGSAMRDTATTCLAIRDAVLTLFGHGQAGLTAELDNGQ